MSLKIATALSCGKKQRERFFLDDGARFQRTKQGTSAEPLEKKKRNGHRFHQAEVAWSINEPR